MDAGSGACQRGIGLCLMQHPVNAAAAPVPSQFSR
jgi:hypothetical protein